MDSFSQKLLILSGVLFAILVGFALLGERTLPLYGGDREFAARASKALFAALGGLAFAFAQPTIWSAFGRWVQSLIGQSSARGSMRDWIVSSAFRDLTGTAGITLCVVFAAVSIGFTYALWTGRL